MRSENMNCIVIGCKKEVKNYKKTCQMHYIRMKKNGDYYKKKSLSRKITFNVTESGCYEVTSHNCYSNGYFMFRLHGKKRYMHRHIFEECFGEIPEGMYICHKCDNKTCINPEHLELGTPLKNAKDAVDRGLYPKGSQKYNAKLTENDVVQIKKMLKNGVKNIEITNYFDVHRDTVSHIKRGKTWKHVTI